MNALKELVDLLGEKNVEHLQERIVEIITARVENDLEQWEEYIFCPENYEEFFDACFDKAKNNVEERIVGELEKRILQAYKTAVVNEGEFYKKGANKNGKV